jgi:hypothetical protein
MAMESISRHQHHEFTPFIISIAIHAFLMLFAITFSYRYYVLGIKTNEPAREINLDFGASSRNNENIQTDSGRESREYMKGGGFGPYRVNDKAAMDLLECAKAGISVTPDNFLEYARIRSMRKGLKDFNPSRMKIAKSGVSFFTGVDHKFKTSYQEYYESICSIINYREKKTMPQDDKSDGFTAAVLDYLDGRKAVRSWRTLWMVQKPATDREKRELILLLRHLRYCSLEGEDTGYEYLRSGINSIMRDLPGELQLPGFRND